MTPDELWNAWLPIVKREREMIAASPFRKQLHHERRSLVYRSMDMVLASISYVQQNQNGTTEEAIHEIETTLYQSMLEHSRETDNEGVRWANRLGAAVARLAVRKLRYE